MKYGALNFIAELHYLFGALILIGDSLFALAVFSSLSPNSSNIAVYGPLAIIVGVFIWGMSTLAFGQLLKLFISVEKNTRETAQLLELVKK